jgi:hypothetical protein
MLPSNKKRGDYEHQEEGGLITAQPAGSPRGWVGIANQQIGTVALWTPAKTSTGLPNIMSKAVGGRRLCRRRDRQAFRTHVYRGFIKAGMVNICVPAQYHP